MSLRVCATTRPKHRSMALWPSPSTASTRSWGKRTKWAIFSTKPPHTESSILCTARECPPGDLYKSVNGRYAAEEFALQLRAICRDHPVDGPSFDQVALRVALSFGRVVAEDEPAGQLGRRTQHSLVKLDDGI